MAKHERAGAVTLHTRESIGTTGAKAARRAGRVPGVLFGHGQASVPIAVDARELAEVLAGGGAGHIISATLNGVSESVLLRELQRDPIGRRPLSVDFQRVSSSEAISAAVPVVVQGTPRGVKDFGGVLDVVTHTLEIRGPAGSLPDELIVDVGALGLGEHLTAGEVSLPPGFALVIPPDTIVVAVGSTRAGVSEGEEGEAPAAAAAPSE